MSHSDRDLIDELDLGTETAPPANGRLESPSDRHTDTIERLRIRGAAPALPETAEYIRDLNSSDLPALSAPRGLPVAPLARIRASHHSLARCLATGMRPAQASLVTGYSEGRISVLQNDPSFVALIADYNAEAKSIFADLAERMSDLSLDAIEELQERLHAAPETFTVSTLLDLIKAFADRTGHGPGAEVHLTMSRDTIDRPPRETYDEWQKRRAQELLVGDSMGSTTRTPN